MKRLTISLFMVMACASMASAGIMDLNVRGNENSTWVENPVQRIGMVQGHYRSNGTYVAPYYRSEPDGYKCNNKSNW